MNKKDKSSSLERVEAIRKSIPKKKQEKKAPRAIFRLPAPDYEKELSKALPSVLAYSKKMNVELPLAEQIEAALEAGIYNELSLLILSISLKVSLNEALTKKS